MTFHFLAAQAKKKKEPVAMVTASHSKVKSVVARVEKEEEEL